MAQVPTRTLSPGELDPAALLKELKYKPGWRFHWDEYTYSMTIEMLVQDTYSAQPYEIWVGKRCPMGPGMLSMLSENDFWLWVREQIHDAERHEADESILIRGDRRFDPHEAGVR